MCFNQRGDISTQNGSSLKLVDKFTYLESSASSTETDIYMQLTKAWRTIDRLLVIWKSELTDKMKRSFIQAAVVSILLCFWRCPWCNGYHRRKWTRWHEFKSRRRLILFHITLIPLGKVWIQLCSPQLWVNSRAD